MYQLLPALQRQHRRFVLKAPLMIAAASAIGLTVNENCHCVPSHLNNSAVKVNQCKYPNKALCESPSLVKETEQERFESTLAHHRAKIAEYRSRWEYKMPRVASSTSTLTSTVTPSRSWPEDVPPDDMLSMLMKDIKYCSRSPNFRSDKEYCSRLRFRVASALIIQFDEAQQQLGLNMLKSLAENGYCDAMTYYGMCLNDGRAGVDPNPVAAVSWFRRCHDMYEHAQAQYELGVAYYTGEGVVENGEMAVRWFFEAAEKDHPAACYMLGDCLLDGEGVEMDRSAALEWLIKSADLGHRGARSRVMAVLEKQHGEDYGRFTDASRQTLVEHTIFSANNKGEILQRRSTMAKPIRGNVIDATELKRRHTIVQNSREKS